ncbi:hypothetical protein [Actinomadura terrae]|uniref:hypothetical protein n=1 Tax=Actinomadura terrae TaxID=604353 RepID=UPI001FA74690|nr:hypothetical protein [Actinomadura terrae]
MLRTQLGGKYHPDDDSVFRLKRRLTRLGMNVSHPVADGILAFGDGHGYAFDPAEHSFADIEADFYARIRYCDVHIVANRFGANLGYLGASAARETAFAMRHHRPIIVLHPVRPTAGVHPEIHQILRPRLDRLVVCDLLTEPDAAITALLRQLTDRRVDYRLTARERAFIDTRTRDFLDGLRPAGRQAEGTDAAPLL